LCEKFLVDLGGRQFHEALILSEQFRRRRGEAGLIHDQTVAGGIEGEGESGERREWRGGRSG
jgi:hypothetical protein